MPDSTPIPPAQSGLHVEACFVRGRQVLLTHADCGPLFVDYYLHHADHALRYRPEQDQLFKRALALFVLHACARPWNELIAWTLHFEGLRLNLFLTADNETGAVTGRLFDEDVRVMDGNCFYADVIRGTQPKRRSVVPFEGEDPLSAIEAFYRQSEQRRGRCYDLGEDRFALLTEHPDCDLAWLEGCGAEEVRELGTQETLAPLERRLYRWHCGCNQGRMLEVLAPVFREDPEGLFQNETTLEMRCPRCAARHRLTREALEAFVQQGRA